jgi:ankyrin repeat protein
MAYFWPIQYANHVKAIRNISTIPLDVCNIIAKYIIDQKTINLYLQYASMNGNLNVIKYLCQNGAEITADDNEAVFQAYIYNHQNVIKYLCQNGAVLGKRAYDDFILNNQHLYKIYG